ncbi:MAG: hypothetical protein ABGY42_10820 [bacterium]
MRYGIGLVLVFFFIGCTGQVYTRGSFVYFDRGNPMEKGEKVSQAEMDRVQIFYKKDPERAFAEVGVVEAIIEGEGVWNATVNDLFPELQRQAVRMRVDAIYKIDLQRYDHGGDALHATGVAVRFAE